MVPGFPVLGIEMPFAKLARRRAGGALLLCFAMLSLTPGSARADTIVVMGDSLSAAYGIDPQAGWVNLLKNRLGDEHEVVNASISGETTSGGWGYRVNASIALAMVRADRAAPGAELEVEIFGERRKAVVQPEGPLWDPENLRLRA